VQHYKNGVITLIYWFHHPQIILVTVRLCPFTRKPDFGARVELGDPLFITISPNSRLSGLCVRLSRYRNTDPLVVHGGATEDSVSPWSLH